MVTDADLFKNCSGNIDQKLADAFHKPHIRRQSRKDVKMSRFLRPVTRYEIEQILKNFKKRFSLDCHDIKELLEAVLAVFFFKMF